MIADRIDVKSGTVRGRALDAPRDRERRAADGIYPSITEQRLEIMAADLCPVAY